MQAAAYLGEKVWTGRSLLILVTFAGSFFSAVTPASAQSDDSFAERLEIADVIAQYSYRWDSKDAEGFASLFTQDATMERWASGKLIPGSRLEGRQTILAYAQESHEGRLADRQTRHHMSGLVFIELTENSALTENMVLITHQTAAEAAAHIASSGIYRNTWRKIDQGWRIAKRVLYTDRGASE